MTGLTPPEHDHTDAVIMAAQWLADQNPAPQPIIPIIRERFGLTALQATEACALSRRYRVNRQAFA